ncbi:MAG: RHS repeat-associated core domain-containing protein [Solirubrobacterales bacterium]
MGLIALSAGISVASGDGATPVASESAQQPIPPGVVELPAKRTANTDTYRLHSGLLETRIYEAPVNYQASEGEWLPIEEGLEEGSEGQITNGANSVEVSLPSELQEGATRLAVRGQWVASKLLATETEPAEVSEGAAVYASPETNSAFEYTTLPNGLKEAIELKGPSSPSSFRYELTSSAGLEAELTESGSVVFKEGAGVVVASLPAPTVADAGSLAPAPGQVSYELAPRGEGAWVLTIAVDRAWLEAPGRKFPVQIDPTMTAEKSDLDCVIGGKTGQEGWIDCASWGRQNLLAGYNAEVNQAEDNWYHTLMYLSTAEIPEGADVSSASLELHAPEAVQNTSGVGVYQVTKPWTWKANWKRYDEAHPWATEGGDYAEHPLGEVTTAARGGGAGWWSIPVEAASVQQAAEHEEDVNVLVKLLDDKVRSCLLGSCTHRLVKFDSSAAATVANRPYLRVVYDFGKAPSTSKLTSPEAGRVSSHYFTLRSEWGGGSHEATTTGVTYQMKLPGWDEFRTIPSKYVLDGKGQAVQWPLPVSQSPGHSEPVYFNYIEAVREEGWQFYEEGIKLRALFAGEPLARGASEPVSVQYADEFDGVGAPTDAHAAVGPVSLDLLTGKYTLSRTDVSIPVPGSESNLEFTRTYESNYRGNAVASKALGRAWQPSAPVEQEFEGEAWVQLLERHENAVPPVYEEECWEEAGKQVCEKWMAEEEIPAADWIELINNEGEAVAFEIVNGAYVAPEYMREYVLGKEGEIFTLTTPEGVRTVFTKGASAGEYHAATISWQTTAKSVRYVYELFTNPNSYRLVKEIAPAPSGVSCSDTGSTTTPGCRTLAFNYFSCGSCWGGYRLEKINYYDPTGSGSPRSVAQYGYDSEYRLIEEWDPRISPVLKETYAYKIETDPTSWTLASLTPPGQEPWRFSYYSSTEFTAEAGHYNWRDEELFGRLKAVSRASLIEATPTATTTVAYQVPLSGSGAPYDLSPSTVATWGQGDYPVDATAIFPPDQVPTSPRPSDFSHASVHYLDPEGYEVNSASATAPGAEGPSITTTEFDAHANVVRELSPQNRLRSLAAGAESATRSHELDTHSTYSSDGTELLESWGPMHQVRLANGESVSARMHQVVKYDEGMPEGEHKPNPDPRLPTKEITGAAIAGRPEDADQRITETHYNWNLLKPTETVVDPGEGHLAITSVTAYNAETGMPVETRQPSNSGGGGAGTTKTTYYTGAKHAGPCEEQPVYAGLPCKVTPAAQASGTGRPELLVREVKSYNGLDEPTEITESPGGNAANGLRKTLLTYDVAGRPLTKKIEGGGVGIPKVETTYSSTLGLPTSEHFVCEAECGSPQFLTSLGYASSAHGPLSHPADVAVDSGGNTWVVDKGNNRIEEFNESGEYIRAVGSLGSAGGQLNSPSAVAIDSLGNLDVTDTANNRVAQFSSTGAFIEVIGQNVNKTKVESGGTAAEKNRCTASSGDVCQAGSAGSSEGQISEPIGITTTGGQNFFVVERANNRVEKFNPQGEVLAKFGETGSGNGQLKEPTAIGFHGFLLWVADTGNNRMEAFTTSYVYSRKFGAEGAGNGQLKRPVAVEADSSGNVWVADEGNNRVQKFSEGGEFLLKFGAGGSEEGKFAFASPMGLTIDAKGNILIADPGNNRVEKFSGSGFDTQATTTSYDALGRATSYEDADGAKATTSLDLDGRPATSTDAKGSQTIRYDANSGLPVEMEASGVGVFTASYNADGSMVKQGLPDGLTAQTTYDASGSPTRLTYTKASNCGSSCTWLNFELEDSISGQLLHETSTIVNHTYTYDKAGRLKEAQETPTGGSCTTRAYTYDKDSNRLTMATREPGAGGACTTSGGTTKSYEYDDADRLMASGLTYDAFGRITKLPGSLAGGKELVTSYFGNDMVATQSQSGVTNTFELDARLRQRQRLQAYGLEGTEIFHYEGSSDAPAWTQRGEHWTRNIKGLGGELAAVQESGSEPVLQLENLHGDVVATAALSPTETKLKATFRFDEFGNPTSGEAGRYGWLGGKQRRTELSSGIVQMGARSYIPQLGRFLTPDSVQGGSANAYDYANQDPINQYDLGGECAKVKYSDPCGKGARAGTPRELRRIARRETANNHVKRFHFVCAPHGGCAPTQVSGNGGGSVLPGFVSSVLGKAVHWLWQHNPANPEAYRQAMDKVIGGVESKVGRQAASCTKAALEGWQEGAVLREAYKVAGKAAAGLWAAGRCGLAVLG